jgi:ankyrin repeat protein
MAKLVRLTLIVSGIALLCVILVASLLFRDKREPIFFAVRAADTNYIAEYLASGKAIDRPISTSTHETATMLQVAAEHSDTNTIAFLLSKGANPDVRDSRGYTVLAGVIEWRTDLDVTNVLGILIASGADPNLPDTTPLAWRPLMWAASLKRMSCVQALLKHGADPTATGRQSGSPIDLAGTSEIRDVLVKAAKSRTINTPNPH